MKNCVYVPIIICIYYNGDTVINETKNNANYATNLIGRTGIEGRNQNGTTGFFVKDMHGDVRGAYTSTGTELANYLYTAWGGESETSTSDWAIGIHCVSLFFCVRNSQLLRAILIIA